MKISRNKYGGIFWTQVMIRHIKKHYHSMTVMDLAASMNMKPTAVRHKCYELGLKKMEKELWTLDQVNFLKAYYQLLGDTEIAEVFEQLWPKQKTWKNKHIEKKRRYLRLKRSKSEIRAINLRNASLGKYNPQQAWETRGVREEGEVSMWDCNGNIRKVIKWSGGSLNDKTYEFLSHVNWILHYGTLPTGKIIVFKDGNPLNCDIDNLKAISRRENAKRNYCPEKASATHRHNREVDKIRIMYGMKPKLKSNRKTSIPYVPGFNMVPNKY